MITAKILRWGNCFSYGPDNELILDENIITQLIGGNGKGKSSIALILEEGFFNKNSKGIKKSDIPNRYIDDGYWIYIQWEKDGDIYEISVTRKTGIKVKLEKNGEDISSHTATGTYKTVQEVLGLDFKTFSQLVYQNTNTSLQFLTATDTNRKKFLIDLFHLEEYLTFFEIFKEAAKDINIEVARAESSIATVQKWLNDNKLTDTTILPLQKIEIDTSADENELQQLIVEIKNIAEKNKKISQNNQYKDLLKRINLREIQDVSVTSEKSYDKLQEQLGKTKSMLQVYEQRLRKLSELGSFCPTCEQEVDAQLKTDWIESAKEDIQLNGNKLKDLQKEILEIQENNNKYRKKIKLQKEWEDLYRNIDNDLPSAILTESELEIRAAQLSLQINEAKKELKRVELENQKINNRNTRIQVIQEQTEKFQEQLVAHQTILDKHSKTLSNLEILKKAFSTNGLLAYKLENLVKELEKLANKYLAELSDGRFTIEFVISNDKLNVQITDEGKVVDILALSSGELARVNTSTLLAIRALMSSISSSKINILFLDEVINVLDAPGREKLIEVLTEEKELNTYIVSHGWEHPLLAKITIEKDSNISRLENG